MESLEQKVSEFYNKTKQKLLNTKFEPVSFLKDWYPTIGGVLGGIAFYKLFDSFFYNFSPHYSPGTIAFNALISPAVGYATYKGLDIKKYFDSLELGKPEKELIHGQKEPGILEERILREKDKPHKFWKIWDWIVDHPSIPSSILPAYFIYDNYLKLSEIIARRTGEYNRFGYLNVPLEEFTSRLNTVIAYSSIHLALLATAIFAVVYVPLKVFSKFDLFKSKDLRTFRHFLSASFYEKIIKNPNKVIEQLEKAVRIEPLLHYISQLAKEYIRNRRLEEGIDSLLHVASKVNVEKKKWFFMPKEVIAYHAKAIAKNPEDVAANVGLAASLYTFNYRNEANKSWKKTLELSNNSPEINCLYAMFLSGVAEEQIADEQWKKTIDVILNQPDAEQQFKQIPSSRFEVYELTTSELLRNNIILNRSDEMIPLLNKSNLTRFVYAAMPDKKLVAKSLTFLEHDGKYYFVMARAKGQTLEEVLEQTSNSEERYKLIKDVALAYAEVDVWATKALEHAKDYGVHLFDYDYVGEFKRRLLDRLNIPEIDKENLVGLYSELAKKYAGDRVFVHGDAHYGNIIVDNNKFCVIDPERAAKASLYLDLASVTEQASSSLSFNTRRLIVSEAINHAEEILGLTITEDFANYRFNEVHINLCLAGTSIRWAQRNQKYADWAKIYTSQVQESMEAFKESLSKTELDGIKEFEMTIKPFLLV